MVNCLVFFDLDDTLYKEIDFVSSAFAEISLYIEKTFGKAGLLEEMLALRDQGRDVFGMIIDKYHLKGLTKEMLLSIYREHFPTVGLSLGADAVLERLKSEGYVLGIITDGRSLTQRNKINALGISSFFDNYNVLISEEIGGEKLSGIPFEVVRDRYPGYELWYVGDNVDKDFAPARICGFHTIGLLDDGRNIHHPVSSDATKEPDYWAFTFPDIEHIICSHNGH